MNALGNFGSLNFTRGIASQPAVGSKPLAATQTHVAGPQDQALVSTEGGDHSWDMSKALRGQFTPPNTSSSVEAHTTTNAFLPPTGQTPVNGIAVPSVTQHSNGTLSILDPMDYHSGSFGLGLGDRKSSEGPSLADTIELQQKSSKALHQAQADCQQNLTLAALMKAVAQGHSAVPTVDVAKIQESSSQFSGEFSKMQSEHEMFAALSQASSQGPANLFQPSMLTWGR